MSVNALMVSISDVTSCIFYVIVPTRGYYGFKKIYVLRFIFFFWYICWLHPCFIIHPSIHSSTHPSIHPSATYSCLSVDSRLSNVALMSFSLATSSSSSWTILRYSWARSSLFWVCPVVFSQVDVPGITSQKGVLEGSESDARTISTDLSTWRNSGSAAPFF